MSSLFALALLLGAPDAAPASPETVAPAEDRLLVFATEASEAMDPEVKAFYDDLFEQALAEVSGVGVIGRRDLQTLIAANSAIKNAASCTDDECLFSIAEMVDVRFFVTGRFTILPTGTMFSLRVYDRQSQSVAVRTSAELLGNHAAVRRAFTRLAEEIVSGLARATSSWQEEPSLWQRLDGVGKLGVGLLAAGIVGTCLGVVLAVIAGDASAAVETLADGRLSDQHAAVRAHDLGWAANGAFIAGASVVLVGSVLTYVGWDAATPQVGVSVQAGGATARVRLSF